MAFTFPEFISYDYFSSLLPFYVKRFTYARMVNPEILCICNVDGSKRESRKSRIKTKAFTFQSYGHRWSLILRESWAHCWCLTSVEQKTFILFKIYFHFDIWLIIVCELRWAKMKVLVASGHCPTHLCMFYYRTKLFSFYSKRQAKEQSELIFKLPREISVNEKLWSISLKLSFFTDYQ